jgi:hypothetical protein
MGIFISAIHIYMYLRLKPNKIELKLSHQSEAKGIRLRGVKQIIERGVKKHSLFERSEFEWFSRMR